MNVVPLIPDTTALQESLAYLPLATYQPGETVLAAGSKTGRLLFLKDGTVAVVRHGIRIAKETEPGTVFGEMSALLDKPHTANVLALTTARFHVADATPCSRKTLSRSFMLRPFLHGVSTTPIRHSLI